MALKFHHIAVATNNINNSAEIFQKLGFYIGNLYKDYLQQVEVQFAHLDNVTVELVAPISSSSPVNNILKKIGTSPYHLCFTSDNFVQDYNYLLNLGFIDITGTKPATAFENKDIVFFYHTDFGLIEVING